MLHRIMTSLPEPRDVFRDTLSQCMSENPDSIRWVVALMALYLHLGPFSRDVIARIETIMATLEPGLVGPRGRTDKAPLASIIAGGPLVLTSAEVPGPSRHTNV